MGPEIDFPIGVPSVWVNILPSIVLKCVSKQISSSFTISSGFQSVLEERVSSFCSFILTHSSAFFIGMLRTVQQHQTKLGYRSCQYLKY